MNPARPARRAAPPARRAFSLVEMLVALTISSMLLTATLVALDAAWKGYKSTTESASTHVVARIVTHRVLAMIRTGTEFGPYPGDVLDSSQNPLTEPYIEFIADADRRAGLAVVTRIERRNAANAENGPFELWYVRIDASTEPGTVLAERPLLRNVSEALFVLEYEPGPRLKRATIDLTVQPNDDQSIRVGTTAEEGEAYTPQIRLVASASPRQFQ